MYCISVRIFLTSEDVRRLELLLYFIIKCCFMAVFSDDDQKYGRKSLGRRYGTIPWPTRIYIYIYVKNVKQLIILLWRKKVSYIDPCSRTRISRQHTWLLYELLCLGSHAHEYLKYKVFGPKYQVLTVWFWFWTRYQVFWYSVVYVSEKIVSE